jgi:hypothetical protein
VIPQWAKAKRKDKLFNGLSEHLSRSVEPAIRIVIFWHGSARVGLRNDFRNGGAKS